MMFDHIHRFGDHGWSWGLFGIVPLIVFLVLIGVAIWAVLRLTSGRIPVSAAPAPPPPARPDGALEEVRLRYARGEISREEFVQRSRDLGGRLPESGDPSPPAER